MKTAKTAKEAAEIWRERVGEYGGQIETVPEGTKWCIESEADLEFYDDQGLIDMVNDPEAWDRTMLKDE